MEIGVIDIQDCCRPAILLAAIVASGLWSHGSEAPAISVGLLLSPTEPEAASLRQGALIGIEHANQAPGLRAELVIRGKPGQWGTEGNEAAALGADEGVAALIAPPDGMGSHQVLQISGRIRVPVVSLCGDASITGAGIPWAVRVSPRNDEEARAIFENAPGAANTAQLRWSALVPGDRAGREAAKDLLAAARQTGCELADPVRLSLDPAQRNSQLEAVVRAGPDGVLLWIAPRLAGEVTRSLRQAGFKGVLGGPGRLRCAAFLEGAGDQAEGFCLPCILPEERSTGIASRFSERYKSRFNLAPDMTAVFAYDAAHLIVEVLRGSAHPAIRGFPLRQTYWGASGPLRFDEAGNRVVSLGLQQWRNGTFQTVKTEPACGIKLELN